MAAVAVMSTRAEESPATELTLLPAAGSCWPAVTGAFCLWSAHSSQVLPQPPACQQVQRLSDHIQSQAACACFPNRPFLAPKGPRERASMRVEADSCFRGAGPCSSPAALAPPPMDGERLGCGLSRLCPALNPHGDTRARSPLGVSVPSVCHLPEPP